MKGFGRQKPVARKKPLLLPKSLFGGKSLDVSEDRKTLTIHAMFASDPEALIASLKSGIERWVIAAVEDFT